MLPTTTTKSAITATTTVNQWYSVALPMECAALGALKATPNGFCGLSAKEALYAVVAKQVVSLDMLTGVSYENAQLLMQQMSVRTLRAELQKLANDPSQYRRLAEHSGVLNDGLRKQLKRMSALYIRADAKAYSVEDINFLLEACEKLVKEKFAGFSIVEIECAFAHAADVDFCAYGALNVQLLSQVLQMYQTRRNKALNAVLDQIAKDKTNVDMLQTVAAKNSDAYVVALAELRALQAVNKTHQCFHTCPHHYAKRFVEEGVFEVSPNDKKILWAEAQAHLAYDLLNDAPTPNVRKALSAYLLQINVVPTPSGRKVRSDVFRANLSPAFEYSKPETHFKEFAQTYYAKKLYFCNIQIFE